MGGNSRERSHLVDSCATFWYTIREKSDGIREVKGLAVEEYDVFDVKRTIREILDSVIEGKLFVFVYSLLNFGWRESLITTVFVFRGLAVEKKSMFFRLKRLLSRLVLSSNCLFHQSSLIYLVFWCLKVFYIRNQTNISKDISSSLNNIYPNSMTIF